MKIVESTFNSSIKKNLIDNYKFDSLLIKKHNETKKSFFNIFSIISEKNNIIIRERETYDDVSKTKGLSIEILHNDDVLYSIVNHRKSTNMSNWYATNLLYYLRRNYIKLK
ncbi:hypothetical protein [Polaribacter sp.]|uniref:hypothetical protein n=1 Tax=Polaribacter sp. TaxID=1920175 RepID=UPI003EF3FBCB